MITQISEQDNLLILLNFTKELIKNSKSEETLALEKKLTLAREFEKKKRPLVKPVQTFPVVSRRFPQKLPVSNYVSRSDIKSNVVEQILQNTSIPSQQRTRESQQPKLLVPDVNLPERFQYLKPVPTKEEMDLGKLNPLILNPQVREIECNGPNTEIVVKSPMSKKTQIILNEDEIESVFETFSKIAKIPIEENIIKIAAGNLILNGINSKVIGSKFIIRKMILGFGR
jgi:hypothetical protein